MRVQFAQLNAFVKMEFFDEFFAKKSGLECLGLMCLKIVNSIGFLERIKICNF